MSRVDRLSGELIDYRDKVDRLDCKSYRRADIDDEKIREGSNN